MGYKKIAATMMTLGCLFEIAACDQNAVSPHHDLEMKPSLDHKPSGDKTAENERQPIPAVIGEWYDKHEGDDETSEFVTYLIVYAGCASEGTQLAVAKNHSSAGECEIIGITPTMNDNGNLYEVSASFDWSSDNPLIAEAVGFEGPHDNLAYVLGKRDLFDMPDLQEPTTTIESCVTNDCPDPPLNCVDKICAWFTVTSIVNLEGAWQFDTPALEDSVFPIFAQDGRAIWDEQLQLKGQITDDSILLEGADNLYIGVISPDRTHIQGEYWDAVNGLPLATWQAEKLSP